MSYWRFIIPGAAEPQGSTRAFVKGKRAIVTSDNPRLKGWRNLAVLAIQRSFDSEMMTGPVHVVVQEFRSRPKSVKRSLPAVKPDIDKIARAALDALTAAGVIADDSLVCSLHCHKEYAERPGLVIQVWDDEEKR